MSEEKVSRKLCFLLESGEVVFPCTMKSRESGKNTFRVSRFGGNVLNHADPKKREEEATEDEMFGYIIHMGYCTRVLLSNGEKSIYSPSSAKVLQVYVPRAEF
jgi:hypothetical protein